MVVLMAPDRCLVIRDSATNLQYCTLFSPETPCLSTNFKPMRFRIIPGSVDMGFRSVVLILALVGCLAFQASAQAPKYYIVQKPFPNESMDDYSLYQGVRDSFRNESLFYTDPITGMSPNVGYRPGVVRMVQLAPTVATAGNWNLELNAGSASAKSSMNLVLFQSKDAVFGYGNIASPDGTSQKVSVGGTVAGNRVDLYVMPEGSSNLYRMSLDMSGSGTMNGDYTFSAQGINQPGVVFGRMLAPQTMQGSYQAPSPQQGGV